MFLVFCSFTSAFDSSQPRDVDKMSDPPAYIFHYFPFFPLRFLSLSLPLYLFFSSFYSMLLHSLIILIYFSMFASQDLSVVFVIAFHCFSFSVPFCFYLLFVSFITLKHRNSMRNNVCTLVFWQKQPYFRKVSNNWKPQKTPNDNWISKKAPETAIKTGSNDLGPVNNPYLAQIITLWKAKLGPDNNSTAYNSRFPTQCQIRSSRVLCLFDSESKRYALNPCVGAESSSISQV